MLDTAKSLAAFLCCSEAKVRKDTRLTDIPRINIGRAVRYDRQAVLSYYLQQEHGKNTQSSPQEDVAK